MASDVKSAYKSKTINANAYHEASVDLADTAAEATSAAVDVLLPPQFQPGRPVLFGLVQGETWDDNAVLLPVVQSYDTTEKRVKVSLKFHNGNAAAGANINPGAKRFWFAQL